MQPSQLPLSETYDYELSQLLAGLYDWSQVRAKIKEQRVQKEKAPKTKICNTCKTTEKKVEICGQCRMAQYCSLECQKKDWRTHKFQCIKTHALSFGIFDILDDAQKGIVAAQVVIGILYLRGYDFKSEGEDSLKEIKELASRDNIYAQQALGAIYTHKGGSWHKKALPYLQTAALAGMVRASMICCQKIKGLLDDPDCNTNQKERMEIDFYKFYRGRFKNIPRMVADILILKQEVQFQPLLMRLERKIPLTEKREMDKLRIEYILAVNEQWLKGKQENIPILIAELEYLSIKPTKAIAKHFLEQAAAQNDPKAKLLLGELISTTTGESAKTVP